jgi:predicted phosphodiesterase
MRVAALYDIHGNLPALDAVLPEVRAAGVDRVVVGGDVVPGAMVRETLQRLLDLELPVEFLHGNCERAVLAEMAAGEDGEVTYWGTVTGAPPPEPVQRAMRWTARELQADYEALFASWPKTLRLDIPGIGGALFCHGTPRSETEVFSRLTPEDRLLPIFEGLGVSLVVCGHTHMQFDRRIGGTRVVNAGSVGMPFGSAGAFWALLGPDVELRRTDYDLAEAAERFRATSYPNAEQDARSLLQPPAEADILASIAKLELK